VTSSYTGLPMTLGNAAAARVRLIVWCKTRGRHVEPDPAESSIRRGYAGSRVARAACLFRVRWPASGYGRHRNGAAIAFQADLEG